MDTRFARFAKASSSRLAMPLDAYAGLAITGESVEDLVSVPSTQFRAIMALNDRYRTRVLVTATDPTAEAEAFGCEVRLTARDIPAVVGRRVTCADDIASLPDVVPGDARTRVPIETAWRLTAESEEGTPVLGTMLGPFSLACRLFGVGETVEAAASREPETLEVLLDVVTGFLCRYALAFRETGAWGVIVAEYEAGQLSPAGLGRFSAPFLKRIVKAVEEPDFAVIYNANGAKLEHLESVRESGAGIYHFGAPLGRVDPEVVLCGNIDAQTVFQKGTPQTVGDASRALLEATRGHKNFVISSGNDIPPSAPLANLNAFYRAVSEFNK
jgi:uroporphyrinogen decarboxylase